LGKDDLNTRPYLIGIAGPSCSGKTKLARHLSRLLSAVILPLDCYYFDLSHLPLAERARCNFDIPEALDHKLLLAHIAGLSQGREIPRPIYDFAVHSRTGRVETVKPGRFVLVEGLFALHWEEARKVFGTKVFVDLDDKLCLERRVARDVRERGRTPDSVLQQFSETVRPMAEAYIRPTQGFADVVIRGNDPIDHSAASVMAHVNSKNQRRGAMVTPT
jgi:uridine kinase